MTPTWPGPVCLVPISIDALVLGTLDLQDNPLVGVGPVYSNLRWGKSPTAPPFSSAGGISTPSPGVQLHWNMPFGLRVGQTQSSGDDSSDVQFPLLPNRWLLVRAYTASTAPSGTAPTLTAWLIRGDVDSDDLAAVPFPSDTSSVKYTFIGEPILLDAPATDAASEQKRIYAMGPGEPSYAVVYQGTQTVLGFYDPMTGLGSGTVSYTAIGFYNPSSWDPLLGVTDSDPQGFTTQDAWAALMQGLLLAIGDGSEAALGEAQAAWQTWAQANGVDPSSLPQAQQDLPALMLPFGGVQEISWRGLTETYGSSVPSSTSVQVAVGNTAVEALGAWLATQVTAPSLPGYSIERLIEALSLDQITTFMSDPVALENAVQAAGFGSATGGTTWVVERPETGFDGNQSFQADQSLPLTEAQTSALLTLVTAQGTVNQLQRALATRQWELFAAQWKASQINSSSPYWTQVQSTITTLSSQVGELTSQLAAAQSEVDADATALRTLLGDDYTLSTASLESFDQPTDPVVLVAGANPGDTLIQVDPDGKPTLLPCRMTGQDITSYVVTADGVTAPLTAQALASTLNLGFLSMVPLPKECQDLLMETFLLDPGVLPWLASTWLANGGAGASLSDAMSSISAIQQALRAGPALDSSLSPTLVGAVLGVDGVPPDPVANHTWTQPWVPLYLDWEVEWHPTSLTASQALSDWALGESDFSWTGQTVSPIAITYTGRTLLNSSAPTVLAQRITQFLGTPTGQGLPIYQREDLEAVSVALAGSGVLTQSLSGLTDLLIQRVPGQASAALSGQGQLDDAVVPSPPVQADESDEPFQPIRAGHFLIKQLWVVDAFGQALKVQQTSGNVVPLRSDEVTTAGAANGAYVQLPPRIAQQTRLDLRLVSASSDAVPTTSSDATSPVCGYLVPSYLDGGLLVFDSAGVALGNLLPVYKDNDASGVRWDAAPGSDQPLGAQPDIDNPHLLALVNGVLAAGRDDLDALNDLLTLLDGASLLADPDWANAGELGAIIGAPIAVVRATVQLELLGDPAYDQAWANTGDQVDGGLPAVSLPARVGDLAIRSNGVVGYYPNDDYDNIYAAYGYSSQATNVARAAADRPTTANSGYVVEDGLLQLGPMRSTAGLDNGAPVAPPAPTTLTVLMAPRGRLPVITGVHPVTSSALPAGPVTEALGAMTLNFRAGPLLVAPRAVHMPLPADIRGAWALTWRDTVTTWTQGEVADQDPTATLHPFPLRLTEGWLLLSGSLTAPSSGD